MPKKGSDQGAGGAHKNTHEAYRRTKNQVAARAMCFYGRDRDPGNNKGKGGEEQR